MEDSDSVIVNLPKSLPEANTYSHAPVALPNPDLLKIWIHSTIDDQDQQPFHSFRTPEYTIFFDQS